MPKSARCEHRKLYYWGSGRNKDKKNGVICDCGMKWVRRRRKVSPSQTLSTLEVTK